VIRVASFLTPAPGDDEEVPALTEAFEAVRPEAGALAFQMSPVSAATQRAGQLAVLEAYADTASYEESRRHPLVESVLEPVIRAHVVNTEGARYEQGPVEVREPGLRDCIQRTMLLRVDPAATPEQVLEFEQVTVAMPRYIDTIVNSSLSRVEECWGHREAPWTHVWEQEFHDVEGFTGPYMQHPYHWSFVDKWFDAMSPTSVASDLHLAHVLCDLDASILALAVEPG
jgi:hypothetical protein